MKLFIGKTKRLIVALLLTLVFFTIGQFQHLNPSYASTYDADAYAPVTGQYSISIPFSNAQVPDAALQSIAFVESADKKIGNELFLTTRSGDTTYVIRCTVSGNTAAAQDYIKLDHFGHGESLEVIKENGKTYLWLGSAAFDNVERDKNRSYWSTKISCVEYTPVQGKVLADFNVLKTFTIDKNGTIAKNDGGETVSNSSRVYERVSIAFSTASILIRQANPDTSMYIYFNNISGGLTNESIENALMGVTNKKVITVPGENDRVYSGDHYSYQSHDNYNGNIYVAGGAEGDIAQIRKLQASTGNDRGVIDINNNGCEMEGIKINSTYIFYMLRPTNHLNKTDTVIYYTPLQ